MQRPVADDDAGGVGGGVGIKPLEQTGDFKEPPDALVLFHGLAQFLLARQRLGERDGLRRILRHQLGEFVDLSERHFENATDAAQNAARQEGAEGDDLRDSVGAVAASDIVDHFAAPRLAEVDVEVRHRIALRVQEAFEEESEADRIQIGDGQRIGDERARAGAASRPDRNSLGFSEFDEVGDDEEVAREAHLLDDGKFEIKSRGVFFPRAALRRPMRGEALLQPFDRFTAQLLRLDFVERLRIARLLHEPRHDRLARLRPEADSTGDLQRVGGRLFEIGEKRAHLGASS